ncbi:MAG: YceI family protein [Saprospiraceae bacterium]
MKVINFLSLVLFAISSYAGVAPKPSSFKVNPADSKVEWFATKITGAHNGTVAVKSGILDFDGEKLTAGKIEMDMTTIAVTDLQGEWGQKLLGHLKSDDFFSVEKNPNALLVISTAQWTSANTYNMTGNLTIKGITKPITFTSIINKAAGTATAEIKVDRTEYNIKYNSGKFFPSIGDKMVNDIFTLKVALAFEKAI